MTRIVDTAIVSSTGKLSRLPEATLPEVAFAGRSNVGKSSLLNALTQRKSLFKVSKSPGRTRTIVHAETRLDSGGRIYLVDLPGFGYAKVSKAMSDAWSPLMEAYLTGRPTLHLVIILVDARRGPEGEEADLADFLHENEIPALLVATKIDRLSSKNKRNAALAKLKKAVGIDVLGTSSATKEGIGRLTEVIARSCGY